MRSGRVWTLSEAARLLGEPQHRLIYLCEKRMVVPDYADATGRGSSRRFSELNLLEFGVALRLKAASLPAESIAAVLYTLRAFEKRVAAETGEGNLVAGLRASPQIELHAVIADGERLFFRLGRQGQETRLFGGVGFRRIRSVGRGPLASRLKPCGPAPGTGPRGGGFGVGDGSRYVRIEINISQVARDLRLEG